MQGKKHAPRWRTAALVLCGFAVSGSLVHGVAQRAQRIEWVQIDGTRHPEMIPEWSAWEDVFIKIAAGSRQLPTSVHTRVSPQEAELVLRESDASVTSSLWL